MSGSAACWSGPGMGDIPQVLTLALTSRAPKVIDADGITHLGDPERLRGQDAILTPHEGEFERLFGKLDGSKAERALEAARRSGAVIVYKGPDTLVASPDGRLGFAPPAPAWLASAGTGDVLAGMIAAIAGAGARGFRSCLRRGLASRSRRRDCRVRQMIADDLADAIPRRFRASGWLSRSSALPRAATASPRAASMSRSAFPATRCSTTARLSTARITRRRHAVTFPECGGCQLQHVDDEAYRQYLVSRVETALAQHGLETEIREPAFVAAEEPPPGEPARAEGREGCGHRLQRGQVAPHRRHAREPYPSARAVRPGRAAADVAWRTPAAASRRARFS